ncbi:MAG: MFS transporter [Aggregatilineaceae bacterium]
MALRPSLRTFYLLIVTQTFSLIGSEMTSLAVSIWVYQESGNVTPLTLAAFFAAVPRLITPSLAGVLADRWDRRYVMMLADAGQAIGTALLLVSFLSDSFQLWHLYLVSAWQAAFSMFQGPAFSASVTMLVPDDQRDRANAVQQMRGAAAGLVAPTLAGALFAVVGAPGVMTIDLFTFAVAITVVGLVHIPRPPQSEEGHTRQSGIWHEALVGFHYLWKRRPLFAMICTATLINFLLNGVGVLITPYVLSLTSSEATLGMLLSLFSAGALVGGLIMSVWGGTRPRTHTIFPGMLFTGLMFAGLGVARSPVALGAVAFALMIPLPIVNAAFDSILQIKVPPDLQGRVFAAVTQLAMLLSPLAYLLSGPLADGVFEPATQSDAWSLVAPLVGSQAGAGIGLMAVIAGTLVIAVTAAAYLTPSMRTLEATLPDYVAVPAEDTDERLPADRSPVAESSA